MKETNIDTQFWSNRLEVDTEYIVRQHESDSLFEKWVYGIKKRAREVLAEQLGINPEISVRDTREAIYARRDDLLEYRFAQAAVSGLTTYSIVEVARARLPEEAVERCKQSEERYDRTALTWLLYADNPQNLELVFHLDTTQRKGFARMVIDPVPEMNGSIPALFFDTSNLQTILDNYEKERVTHKKSHCAVVLDNGGGYQLFIKRDMKPGFVSRDGKVHFGFQREWIVLQFDPDLRRVHICSVTPDTPLLLANRLASTFFGTDVHYNNESIKTSADKVHDFFQSMLSDPARLPLVELTFRNSGLEGGLQIKLNASRNISLAGSIRQISDILSDPFAKITDVESIKVHKFNKRV